MFILLPKINVSRVGMLFGRFKCQLFIFHKKCPTLLKKCFYFSAKLVSCLWKLQMQFCRNMPTLDMWNSTAPVPLLPILDMWKSTAPLPILDMWNSTAPIAYSWYVKIDCPIAYSWYVKFDCPYCLFLIWEIRLPLLPILDMWNSTAPIAYSW